MSSTLDHELHVNPLCIRFVEVVPRVPLRFARGFIHLSCDSIQSQACGRPASWLSMMSKFVMTET